MIFNQSTAYYIFSWFFAFVVFFRMHFYFKDVFDREFSWLVPFAILIHPLSIDLFLAPNFVSGSLAFWLFIESLLFFKKKKILIGCLTVVIAGICNISFIFVAFYMFWKYRREFIKYKAPLGIFFFFSTMYIYQNLLVVAHNPFNFLVRFLEMLILPLTLTIFNFSLFPFSLTSLILVLVILGIFLIKQKINSASKQFWPLLVLPVLGIFFHPWTEQYKFWHEIIFNSSSYICITFSFITILAIHTNRSIFYAFIIMISIVSVNWGRSWFPLSNLLQASINSFPQQHTQIATAKRLLAWEYFHEGNSKEAMTLIESLSKSGAFTEDLKNDLIYFKSKK